VLPSSVACFVAEPTMTNITPNLIVKGHASAHKPSDQHV
jgi:hypothetical protein